MHKNCLTYPVEFVSDAFGESDALAKMLLGGREGAAVPRVFIVADQNVVQRTEGLGTRIGRYVRTYGIELAGSPVVVGGGEKAKLDDAQSGLMVVSEILRAEIVHDPRTGLFGDRKVLHGLVILTQNHTPPSVRFSGLPCPV